MADPSPEQTFPWWPVGGAYNLVLLVVSGLAARTAYTDAEFAPEASVRSVVIETLVGISILNAAFLPGPLLHRIACRLGVGFEVASAFAMLAFPLAACVQYGWMLVVLTPF